MEPSRKQSIKRLKENSDQSLRGLGQTVTLPTKRKPMERCEKLLPKTKTNFKDKNLTPLLLPHALPPFAVPQTDFILASSVFIMAFHVVLLAPEITLFGILQQSNSRGFYFMFFELLLPAKPITLHVKGLTYEKSEISLFDCVTFCLVIL